MKRFLGVVAGTLLLVPMVMAYQVTGPVLDVTDSKIVVQKGKEKWEMARDASTKMSGDVKKDDKVTVEYSMTATNITVKGAGKEKAKAKGKGKDKSAPAAAGAPAAKY